MKFAVPYSQYWRFKDAMAGQADAAEVYSDAEISQFLAGTAIRLEIPLRENDIRVRRGRDAIEISAAWSREVVLPRYARTLRFNPVVRAPVGGPPP
ncbi:MAG: hypothetical protein H0V09_00315 [Gemmatimonadetes bacterium]|nr:hypothetical protein [Gemmatimonadota bacterium]